MLPWIVIEEAMAKQPESFVPFTAGSQGALAELLSCCCCAPIYRLVTCFPGCIAVQPPAEGQCIAVRDS